MMIGFFGFPGLISFLESPFAISLYWIFGHLFTNKLMHFNDLKIGSLTILSLHFFK